MQARKEYIKEQKEKEIALANTPKIPPPMAYQNQRESNRILDLLTLIPES